MCDKFCLLIVFSTYFRLCMFFVSKFSLSAYSVFCRLEQIGKECYQLRLKKESALVDQMVAGYREEVEKSVVDNDKVCLCECYCWCHCSICAYTIKDVLVCFLVKMLSMARYMSCWQFSSTYFLFYF